MGEPQYAEIDYDAMVNSTSDAILFDIGDREIWIPLGVIHEHDEDERIVTIQEWFAFREGLI